ncbi:3-ketoacyl-(acyl-carrier-protein) reductase [Neobacillus bataviensis LMG 21833]|uniref:3-ketoacyl-(Acyl-carrier-protein) reductase n=1 Tax=Neobacillus bataviensis LMG 21833 TaxID=1117379 RepID=K6CYR2_9BACI|nr:SDR family oxidoreductase [Neobacillus bataviensis]EKN65372.1 3-ketoacyl-(acyl-carrier-protein) reductase [Neobacillus bataviensis LMG 21833]
MKKFVLITGASGGIGQAVAINLAQKGYSLYLHYNKNDQSIRGLLDKLRPLGGEYIPIQANLADSGGYKSIAPHIFSLDAIIHCSGNSQYGLLVDLQQEDAVALMNVHVVNPLMLTKELLPKFLRKGSGNIIVITSIWGQTGASCEVAYSAAKGAQIAFVKALSKEVALNGIRVNAIAPGAVATPMMESFTPEEVEQISFEIPMGRLGLPEEIAGSVAFLLSDDSSYITGQVLGINGGWYT